MITQLMPHLPTGWRASVRGPLHRPDGALERSPSGHASDQNPGRMRGNQGARAAGARAAQGGQGQCAKVIPNSKVRA